MSAWNPDLYLKFEKERTQPSIDLVARIDVSSPERIIDIGCGPGNGTKILREKSQTVVLQVSTVPVR